MSVREARFEIVRSDAGWFARFRAANGRKVWQTEVYARSSSAIDAIQLVTGHVVEWIEGERLVQRVCRDEWLEVRYLDERTEPTP